MLLSTVLLVACTERRNRHAAEEYNDNELQGATPPEVERDCNNEQQQCFHRGIRVSAAL